MGFEQSGESHNRPPLPQALADAKLELDGELEGGNQVHRYFYVFPPSERSTNPKAPKLRPFDKMESLSSHLCTCFQRFWNPGTQLIVDEVIQGFQGRASEIVTVPSKPTPTGFKIWVLAVNGYILDFLWHARGSNKRDGPQNLDPRWKKEGFCATQAVVLTLLLFHRPFSSTLRYLSLLNHPRAWSRFVFGGLAKA
jgi:hypothetical protein